MIEHNDMILPDNTLEACLDYKNKANTTTRDISLSLSTVCVVVALAGATTDFISDYALSEYGDPYFRRIMVTCGSLGTVFGILSLVYNGKIEKYSKYYEYIKQLMQDPKLAADIHRELIRLMPLVENMITTMSIEHPDIAHMFKNGELKKDQSEQDLHRLTAYAKEYLREHQDAAKQFLSFATVDKMDVRTVERFMAECMPNTITFAQAQKLCGMSK